MLTPHDLFTSPNLDPAPSVGIFLRILMTEHETIWDYQPHFRVALQAEAEQIFSSLDHDLVPQVMLVGVGIEEERIVFAPNDGFFDESAFHDLFPLAQALRDLYESPEALHRRVGDHGRAYENDHIRAMRDILTASLQRQHHGHELVPFVAPPIRINNYWVFTALQFGKSVYAVHAHDGVYEQPFDISSHLVDAAIAEFLSASAKALTDTAPGSKVMVLGREPHEILRAAASTLLYRRTYSLRKWGYPIDLFDACNAISAMKYEGSAGKGSMIVSSIGDERVEVFVELQERVPLHDHRSARKLLEMATEHLDLLSDAGYIYGLGLLRETPEDAQQPEQPMDHNFFRINFVEHFEWELVETERTVMRVSYGQPTLLGKPINSRHFRSNVERIFGHLPSLDLDRLWNIALAATRQRHGTMLVISEHAEQEVRRLQNQCIPVHPMSLTPHIVETVTAIDGAIMADPRGVCHAIGVILDGLAHHDETASRGARYNSAVRYVHTMRSQFGHAALAVVVSKDGMVDTVPRLMPRIERARVEEMLEHLRELSEREEPISFDEFSATMSWLDAHRFYLFERDAFAINTLIDAVLLRIREGSGQARLAWPRFLGNTELDMSFFEEVEKT